MFLFQCFSSDEVFRELNTSKEGEITKGNLPESSTIIVSKLLNRHCINIKHQKPLPCPSFFAHNLFSKYAKNDFVDIERMEKLLKKLKIGKDDEHKELEDNHARHDHGRRRRYILARKSLRSLSVDEISLTFRLHEKQPRIGRYRRHAKEVEDSHTKKIYERVRK